jgi:hypothetical protein
MIKASAAYLAEAAGGDAARVTGQLSAPTRSVIESANPAGWYPVSVISEVHRAVVTLSKGNPDKARTMLVNCGSGMAREATNTFLRILMRMLTPTMFSKKLPGLWSRDCSRGKLTVEVTDQKLVFTMTEIQGFEHAVCTGTGFAVFALESMGKSVQSTNITGWSLDNPCADGARAEIVWKA